MRYSSDRTCALQCNERESQASASQVFSPHQCSTILPRAEESALGRQRNPWLRGL